MSDGKCERRQKDYELNLNYAKIVFINKTVTDTVALLTTPDDTFLTETIWVAEVGVNLTGTR